MYFYWMRRAKKWFPMSLPSSLIHGYPYPKGIRNIFLFVDIIKRRGKNVLHLGAIRILFRSGWIRFVGIRGGPVGKLIFLSLL